MRIPLVSILITAYNRERYIAEAVESVLAQTVSDYELIIVDDCSQDNTVGIAERYTKDPRVRLLVNKTNLGQFQNRNYAASLAKGKYLKYVDSDDVIYPHCLDVMVNSMETFPKAGVGICRKARRDLIYPVEFKSLRAYRESLLGAGLLSNAPTSTIYVRRVFEQCGGFQTGAVISDTLFLHKLVATYSVVLMTNGLTWYRFHENQTLIHDKGYNRNMVEVMRFLPECIYSKQCPLPKNEQDQAYANITGNFIRYCLRLLLCGKFSKFILSWKASGIGLSTLKYAAVRPRRPYKNW